MIHSVWSRYRTLQQRIRGQRGSVLVVVASSMLALTSVVALSIDVGLMTTARVEAQRAADAAALAGAGAFVRSPGNEGLARQLASDYAGQNTVRGQCALRSMGFQSIPIVNVENACCSSSEGSCGQVADGSLSARISCARPAASCPESPAW